MFHDYILVSFTPLSKSKGNLVSTASPCPEVRWVMGAGALGWQCEMEGQSIHRPDVHGEEVTLRHLLQVGM